MPPAIGKQQRNQGQHGRITGDDVTRFGRLHCRQKCRAHEKYASSSAMPQRFGTRPRRFDAPLARRLRATQPRFRRAPTRRTDNPERRIRPWSGNPRGNPPTCSRRGHSLSVDGQQFGARREPDRQSALERHSDISPQRMPPGSFRGRSRQIRDPPRARFPAPGCRCIARSKAATRAFSCGESNAADGNIFHVHAALRRSVQIVKYTSR